MRRHQYCTVRCVQCVFYTESSKTKSGIKSEIGPNFAQYRMLIEAVNSRAICCRNSDLVQNWILPRKRTVLQSQDTRTCCDPSTINNEHYARIRSSRLPLHHYITLSEISSMYLCIPTRYPVHSTHTHTLYREYTHYTGAPRTLYTGALYTVLVPTVLPPPYPTVPGVSRL